MMSELKIKFELENGEFSAWKVENSNGETVANGSFDEEGKTTLDDNSQVDNPEMYFMLVEAAMNGVFSLDDSSFTGAYEVVLDEQGNPNSEQIKEMCETNRLQRIQHQTDFDKIQEKLQEVGAIYKGGTIVEDDEQSFSLDFYIVGGHDLILWSNAEGKCGLYSFVGNNGDPVEKDLEFIENLANKDE